MPRLSGVGGLGVRMDGVSFFQEQSRQVVETLDGSLEADKTKGTGIQCLEGRAYMSY
jgi:hypothetical protein